MVGLIGSKIGMVSFFDESDGAIGVSVIKVDGSEVLEVKSESKYGYSALKLGYGVNKKEKRKPVVSQYKGRSIPKKIKEFRLSQDEQDKKAGDVLGVEELEGINCVDVRGVSIGKGFQGVMKRWNMHGGPDTHGSRFHRVPGSIGNCSDPARVFKGKKMPGQMGRKNTVVKNLKVVQVDKKNGLLLVKGSIPGNKDNLVYITPGAKNLKWKG